MCTTGEPNPPFQGAGARVRGAKFPKNSCLTSKERHFMKISLVSAHPAELGLPSMDFPAPPAWSGLIWAPKGSQSPFSQLGNEFSAQPVKSLIVTGVLLKRREVFLKLFLIFCFSGVACFPFYFIYGDLRNFLGFSQISPPAPLECQDPSHPSANTSKPRDGKSEKSLTPREAEMEHELSSAPFFL